MRLFKLQFHLANPLSGDYFLPLVGVHTRLTKNKYLELEHMFCSQTLVDFDIDISIKQDHAGIRIAVGVLGYSIIFQIYDCRHWNPNENNWVN